VRGPRPLDGVPVGWLSPGEDDVATGVLCGHAPRLALVFPRRWQVYHTHHTFEDAAPGQAAVLYRTNAQSRAMEEAMRRAAIPYRLVGAVRFYVAYSVALHEVRGRKFTWALVLSAVLTTLITVLIGLWLSGRLTRQIDDLARRVRRLDGQPGDDVLAGHYRESEVSELAAAFDGYHERTTRLLERERAFTADVSHELRTPLTAIQTGCELMLGDPGLSPKARARAEKIAAAAGRLTDLVNAFLLMAREQAEAISSEVDLRDCVEEAAENVRERAEAKGLSLRVDVRDSVHVRVPQKALQIVLANLLANAVSYTEQGSVSLSTEGAAVKIEDTGCGVAADKVPELFRRFRRGDARSGDGYGLGLAIVKRICEQVGWRIGIEPRPEGGTRVLLTLARFDEDFTKA